MHKTGLSVIAIFIAIFLASCSPKSAPAPAKAVPDSTADRAATAPQSPKEKLQEEWDSIVREAKKEQKVVVYGVPGAEVTRMLSEGLKSKYGIIVEGIAGRGSEVTEKLVAEHKAGLYLADVFISGSETAIIRAKPAGVLTSIEPALILSEVTDPKIWYRGELPFLDRGRYVLSFLAYPSAPLTINTTMVKTEELRSFRDLLNPKWKGKIILNNPLVPGSGSKWVEVMGSGLLGWDFLRELAKQDLLITQDQRLQVEWVARGKYPIAIATFSPAVTELRLAGAPITEWTPAEGTHSTSGQSNTGLVNKAAHPNAARVFINWLFSLEGQSVASRGYGRQSARIDVPTDHLDSVSLRDPKIKYFNGDDEDWLLKQPERIKIVREIFGTQPR